jgi:hypothetical protein
MPRDSRSGSRSRVEQIHQQRPFAHRYGALFGAGIAFVAFVG